jgi:O-antigen/teichoic acid export membrane protein
VLSLGLPLLFAFVSTPLVIHGLGVEEYGYYSILLAVIGLAFTTGIGRMPVKYVAEKLARGKNDELVDLLSASIWITLAVASVEAFALALASPFLISQVFKVPTGAEERVLASLYLTCLIGSVMMVNQLFQSALQGVHRFRVYALITIAASFMLNLGAVFLSVSGFPYFDILIWNLCATVCTGLAFFVFAKQSVPELRIRFNAKFAVLRKVGAFAFSIFVYQTITSVFYLFERSYVLRNYGAETLTYYTVPLMLGFYLHGVVLAISHVTVPKFNERIFELTALSAVYSTLTKIVAAVATLMTLMCYCLGDDLLHLWLGEEFAARSSALLLTDVVAFALIAIVIPSWILSESARRPGMNASSPLVTSLVGIAGVVVFEAKYGPQGVAFGRLAGAAASLPLIFIAERLVFGRVMWRTWRDLSLKISPAAVIAILLHYGLLSRLGVSWPLFLMSALLLTLVFCGVLWLLKYFDPGELASAFASNHYDEGRHSEMTDGMQ